MRLATPLRVTWDWNWPPVVREGKEAGPVQSRRIRRIGAQLARAKVLMLEIGYPGIEELRDGLVAELFRSVPAVASLAVSPELLAAPEAENLIGETGAAECWADLTPLPEETEGKVALPRRGDGKVWPDLRIYLTSRNRLQASSVMREALKEGCRRFSLPIPPLFGSFLKSADTVTPAWRELVEFADRLESFLEGISDLDLRVHNQALWTILKERGIGATEAEAPGHSGCQAASALAYVDPAGTLYPCAALPVPLGRVEDTGLLEIWSGEECRSLRSSIEAVPPACRGCALWESCRGGCRGWAYYASGAWNDPGPDCGRPRSDSRLTE